MRWWRDGLSSASQADSAGSIPFPRSKPVVHVARTPWKRRGMSGAARKLVGVMTTVGFIGSGNIGGTVARLAVAAGYDVVLSNSRGPQTLKELVDELGPRASAATSAE